MESKDGRKHDGEPHPKRRPSAMGRSRLGTFFLIVVVALGVSSITAQEAPMGSGSIFGALPDLQVDPSQVGQRFQEELERCRRLRGASTNVHERAGCTFVDAMSKLGLGQHQAGLAELDAAQRILEEIDDRFGLAMLGLFRAETAKQLGRTEESIAAYRGSLAALEELQKTGAPLDLGMLEVFERLGMIPVGVVGPMQSMVQMVRPMLINQLEMTIRQALAAYLVANGRYDEADSHLQQALVLSRRLLGLMDGRILDQLGVLRQRQGRLDEARDFFRQALDAAQRFQDHALIQQVQRRLDALAPSDLDRAPSGRAPIDRTPREPSSPSPQSSSPTESPASAPRTMAPMLAIATGGVGGDGVSNPLSGGGLIDLSPGFLESLMRREDDGCRDLTDPLAAPECLVFQGLLEVSSGQLGAGLERLETSLEAFRVTGDRLGRILALWAMGSTEVELQRYEVALELFERALSEVENLLISGESIDMGFFEQIVSRAGWSSSVEAPPWLQARRQIVLLRLLELIQHDGIGQALVGLDRLPEAEASSRRAAELADSFLGLMDTQIYDHLAQIVALQGRYEEAAGYYQRALEGSFPLGEVWARLGILRRMAILERVRGRESEALRLNRSALELARRHGDLDREASILVDQVNLAADAGSVREALGLAEEAIRVADSSDDFLMQTLARLAHSRVALVSGDYELALETLEDLLAILKAVDSDLPEVAVMRTVVLNTVGGIYSVLGRPESMADKAAEAAAVAQDSQQPLALAWSELMQEFARLSESRPEVLEEGIHGLLETLRQSDSLTVRRLGQNSTLLNIVPLLPDLDQLSGQRARDWLAEIEANGLGVEERWGHYAATLVVAMDLGAMGRLDEALETLDGLLVQAREREHTDLEAWATAVQSKLYLIHGRQTEAARSATAVVELFDRLAVNVQVEGLLSTFFAGERQRSYRRAVWLVSLEGRAEEAFRLAERARARTLLQGLGNRRLDFLAEATPEVREQLASLRAEILDLEGVPDGQDLLAQKLRTYQEAVVRMQLQHPEVSNLLPAQPLDLAALQQGLLPPETTLISYFRTPGFLVAWVIDRDRMVQQFLPFPDQDRIELLRLAEWLGLDSNARGSRGVAPTDEGPSPFGGASEKFYQRLIEPIRPYIRHDRWIVVPHDVLHYLPFAALREPGGRPLMESAVISYLSSASALQFSAERSSSFDSRALVLGDPVTDRGGLEGAREEARAVAELFGTEAWIGDQATEWRVRQAAGEIDLLHLAAHGIYQPQVPYFSHIALAEGEGLDGRLEVGEISSSLDLTGVNLVTLSACQTAAGERDDGDEIISLTRAFLDAGSSAVVSTLWRVDDQATAFLMKRFYQNLEAGESYAESLREAQRATRSRDGWSDPYYWAAFTLTGDPEGRWRESVPTANLH